MINPQLKYSKEQKAFALQLILKDGYSYKEASKATAIPEVTLYSWTIKARRARVRL